MDDKIMKKKHSIMTNFRILYKSICVIVWIFTNEIKALARRINWLLAPHFILQVLTLSGCKRLRGIDRGRHPYKMLKGDNSDNPNNGHLIRGMTVRAMMTELLMCTHDDDDSACVTMWCQCLVQRNAISATLRVEGCELFDRSVASTGALIKIEIEKHTL